MPRSYINDVLTFYCRSETGTNITVGLEIVREGSKYSTESIITVSVDFQCQITPINPSKFDFQIFNVFTNFPTKDE